MGFAHVAVQGLSAEYSISVGP